ncbi:MAG: MarR family transcriptional regulator [Chloroflexi bacterium]|nr:MarR family transcriptional regulator [Chloroflexota bacterium]
MATQHQHHDYSAELLHIVKELIHSKKYLQEFLPEGMTPQRGNALPQRPNSLPLGPGLSLFFRVSVILSDTDSPTMSELSTGLGVPTSTATRMVDWLEAVGFIHRLADPRDRRVVRVVLTDKGRELRQAMDARILERIHQALDCLSPEEQVNLVTLLQKVASALLVERSTVTPRLE